MDISSLYPSSNSISHNKTHDDYIFEHTDSHKIFMDLLLAKRKKLENEVMARNEEVTTIHEGSQFMGKVHRNLNE